MANEIHITGLKELEAKLESLATKQAENFTRKALRAGAKVQQEAIAEAAPVKISPGGILPEGALKGDITTTTKKNNQGQIIALTGPGKATAYVARWVEYGHRLIEGGYLRFKGDKPHRGTGKVIGHVPPHPFMRPAFEDSAQKTVEAVAASLRQSFSKVKK